MPFWPLLTAACCAAACALPGTFLVLRRLSLLGDALSHAVLPGVVVAYLFAGDRGGPMTLLGAAVAGAGTALLTEWVRAKTRTEESAALGVVFSTLFAIGLVLISKYGREVDLDLDCVLFGSLESSLYETVSVAGQPVPKALFAPAAVLVFGAAFAVLCFKELRLAAFDPALARAMGLRPVLLHAVLCAWTAVACVACFRVVGSVLVLGMLVIPPATALLLSRRLALALPLAAVLAVACAPLGFWLATRVPPLLSFGDTKFRAVPMTPAMGVASGLLLLAAAGGMALMRRRNRRLAPGPAHESAAIG